MANDCLRRAIACGLAYMGRRDEDLSFIPDFASSDMLPEICARLDLALIGNSGPGRYEIEGDDFPILVVYDMERNDDEGRRLYHAVFASDYHVFTKWKIQSLIVGWDGKRKHRRIEPIEVDNGNL